MLTYGNNGLANGDGSSKTGDGSGSVANSNIEGQQKQEAMTVSFSLKTLKSLGKRGRLG
jgi:hypothetical protein